MLSPMNISKLLVVNDLRRAATAFCKLLPVKGLQTKCPKCKKKLVFSAQSVII